MRNRFALTLLFVLLAVLPALTGSYAQSSFPAEIKDLPGLNRFPAEVAGYRRAEIVAYAPGLTSFSVAYNRYDDQQQNALTLYFGPRANDTAAQLRDEKAAVVSAHPDSRVVSERSLSLGPFDLVATRYICFP